jgi:hypothetical protein
MKRRLVWAWVILLALTMVFLTVLLPFTGPSWYDLEQYAKGIGVCFTLTAPAVRYLRRTPADRAKLRELKDIDRKLDEIDREQAS